MHKHSNTRNAVPTIILYHSIDTEGKEASCKLIIKQNQKNQVIL